ncbi:MAG: TrkA family potassium uptake protein [Clostridia bacterium]|nr:TrkA family potassium uptake protein [Clostridia bacterium]
MSIHKSYAVFGLGRYGRAVATELAMSGAEVMAVDVDEKITEEVIADIPVCKCADVTDKEVISRLGISNFDTVIIAMAMRFEVSVMATMLCKEAGVETVIVKCANEVHKKYWNVWERIRWFCPRLNQVRGLHAIFSVTVLLTLLTFRTTFPLLKWM